MTWESKEEQVMHVISQHMKGMIPGKKEVLVKCYAKAFFRNREQVGYTDVRWNTSHEVTFVRYVG